MAKLKCTMVVGFLIALFAPAGWANGQAENSQNDQLFRAARDGHVQRVRALLESAADANVRDSRLRTPLHEAAAHGHQLTAQALLDGGADINAVDSAGRTPLDEAEAAGHSRLAGFLRDRGALTGGAAGAAEQGPALKPSLEFGTLGAFEKEIGERAVLLDSRHVCLFAPMRRLKEAAVVFPYLVAAYDELHEIVGRHTDYKIAVYAFPKGNPHGWGGTSYCSIEYDEANLQLDSQPEWLKHGVPHVSGYIEEMAHSFVHATNAQFGWEMIGWSLGAEVSQKIAGNPILQEQIANTRKVQRETYDRYVRNGCVLPGDVPADKCDRIHAWILWQCAEEYGAGFWKDFFREIRAQERPLREAAEAGDADTIRNARYRVTVDCFDRLPGLSFKKVLQESGISLTTDVKSLHPERPQWDRRLHE